MKGGYNKNKRKKERDFFSLRGSSESMHFATFNSVHCSSEEWEFQKRKNIRMLPAASPVCVTRASMEEHP